MSTDARVKVGDVLAEKFRVDKVVGEGGMGVVVEATHLTLDQRVALKFLNERARKDSSAVARFEREARAAARLRSEHVVRIIDVGVMGDSALPRDGAARGPRPRRRIRSGGRLAPPIAVDYVVQVCDAVAEAHRTASFIAISSRRTCSSRRDPTAHDS